MDQDHTAYIPGNCNISPEEVALRRKAGYLGLISFSGILIGLLILDMPSWVRLILFAPAFIGVIGFLQASARFCVAYGSSGRQHADGNQPEPQPVTDPYALEQDKKKARRLNFQAAIIAASITVVTLFIPPLSQI